MPFPDEGPTSLALVKAHLGITDEADDLSITEIVDAVNAEVREFRVAQPADQETAPADWTSWPQIITGATMLAARIWRRRHTPDGVAGFADNAPVYVQRNDPDVALLLQLGDYAKPAVG